MNHLAQSVPVSVDRDPRERVGHPDAKRSYRYRPIRFSKSAS